MPPDRPKGDFGPLEGSEPPSGGAWGSKVSSKTYSKVDENMMASPQGVTTDFERLEQMIPGWTTELQDMPQGLSESL